MTAANMTAAVLDVVRQLIFLPADVSRGVCCFHTANMTAIHIQGWDLVMDLVGKLISMPADV